MKKTITPVGVELDDFERYQRARQPSLNTEREYENRVTITAIKIPFFSLMWFLVKFIIAAIPAIIIANIIIGALIMLLLYAMGVSIETFIAIADAVQGRPYRP